jgi:hypothetical protein
VNTNPAYYALITIKTIYNIAPLSVMCALTQLRTFDQTVQFTRFKFEINRVENVHQNDIAVASFL